MVFAGLVHFDIKLLSQIASHACFFPCITDPDTDLHFSYQVWLRYNHVCFGSILLRWWCNWIQCSGMKLDLSLEQIIFYLFICVQEENIKYSFMVVYSQRRCVHLGDLWTIYIPLYYLKVYFIITVVSSAGLFLTQWHLDSVQSAALALLASSQLQPSMLTPDSGELSVL